MMRANWKSTLLGSIAVLAVAVVGVEAAVSTKSDPLLSTAKMGPYAERASELWEAAAVYVQDPVREETLRDSGAMGKWFDDYSGLAAVGSEFGTLVVTRDFGSSEDADLSTLRANAAGKIQSVTVGFKSIGEDQWFWARFDAEGNVEHDLNGRLFAGHFHASADAQCVAEAWSAMEAAS